MEIKTFNYEIENNTKEDLKFDNYLQEKNNQLPFIHIKNTDLIIFIDFNILCINIKTGKLISYLCNLNHDDNDEY